MQKAIFLGLLAMLAAPTITNANPRSKTKRASATKRATPVKRVALSKIRALGLKSFEAVAADRKKLKAAFGDATAAELQLTARKAIRAGVKAFPRGTFFPPRDWNPRSKVEANPTPHP